VSSEAPRTDDEFRTFYRWSYNRTLRRLMAKSRLSQQDAEDVLSKAYQETARCWRQIRDPQGFLWDRVSKRLLDHVEKAKRAHEREFLCDVTDNVIVQAAPAGGEPEQCVGLLRLNELFGRLSADDQKVIALAYSGASKEEQAKAFGSTVGAVKVRLSRATMKLRKLVAQDQEAEVR
jgi:DNA-directed RNA polymerase specialized sigma24 family protein